MKQGIANLMLIQSAFARAASTIKISEPMRRQMVGEAMQSIGVRLVEFDAKAFAEQTPPPTTQQRVETRRAFEPGPDDGPPAPALIRWTITWARRPGRGPRGPLLPDSVRFTVLRGGKRMEVTVPMW